QVQDSNTGAIHDVQVYCSADYLDLGKDRRVIQAACDASSRFGVSVSSVPLIAGSTTVHHQLETELAAFLRYESCVLFPTGQGANVSTIAALCTSSDSIVIDKQVHYSVLEGVKLAGAPWRSFRHCDSDHLDSVLKAIRKRRPNNGILVIIEGVYGLDGNVTPLPEILEVSRRYNACVMLDDAHATGVLGPRGAGTAEHFGMKDRPDILMGSFSKAFGSFGGFIAASKPVVDYLRYFAKSISFSIGLPPANAAAALQSLHILRDDPAIVPRLRSRCHLLRDSFVEAGFKSAARSQSAITSILVGSESGVKESTRDLFNAGVWAEGLPFPAVSRGQERIRFRARLSHTDEQIHEAVSVVRRIAVKYGYLKQPATSFRGESIAVENGAERTTQLMELVYASNNQRSVPPSWLTSEYKRKQIEKSEYWEEAQFEQEWFHTGNGTYTAAACAMAFPHRGAMVGSLGHFAWLPGQDQALLQCVRDGLDWLKIIGVSVVYAPMQLPMQILGAGVPEADTVFENRPFLEATNDPQLIPLLTGVGFRPAESNKYFKIDLATVPSQSEAPSTVSFRNFDRERLRSEINHLAPLLNETVSTLPLCSPLTEGFLHGVASELRDLILPGFWRLAFEGDRLVGFITAFPNVTEAVSQACGLADVADLVKVSDALDNVDEGFVAWMGVSPQFANAELLSVALLSQVFDAMKRKGIRKTWLSWELHNGVRQLTEADFASQSIVDRMAYTIHRLSI
ncbi:MAG: aminotransferase class I/II-fold pyridoxal phosphate-dependent enzyme, partial [Burkholderiales bacterium]